MEAKINLDADGEYMGCDGAEYQQLKSKLRTLRRQKLTKMLKTCGKHTDKHTGKTDKIQQIVGITRRISSLEIIAETATRQAKEEKERAQTAVVQMERMTQERDRARQLVSLFHLRIS